MEETKKQIEETNFIVSKREALYFENESQELLFIVTNPVFVPKIGDTITVKLGGYADNVELEVFFDRTTQLLQLHALMPCLGQSNYSVPAFSIAFCISS